MVASWLNEFSQFVSRDELIDNAITSCKTLRDVKKQAEDLDIETHSLVYEALRDRDPREVIEPLFRNLGLPLSERVFEDWTGLPGIGVKGSNVTIPPEPERYEVVNGILHRKLNASSGLHFYESSRIKVRHTLGHDIHRLRKSSMFAIYDEVKTAYLNEQDLPIIESQETRGLLGISPKESRMLDALKSKLNRGHGKERF